MNNKFCSMSPLTCTPDSCNKPNPPCPEHSPVYGYFSQNGRIFNSALFGGIRFTNPPIATDGFFSDDTVIQIFNPGIYLVTYIVNFPEDAVVDTTLSLQLDNQNTLGMVRNIIKSAGSPYTAVAQTIIRVEEISAIRVSSSAVIDIVLPGQDTAASLSIIKL